VTALNPDDREQNINALVSGRIEQWYVRDGSTVNKGDPIVRLVDNDPRLLERLKAERGQMEIQLQAAKSGLATSQLDLNRMKELFDNGLVARRDYELAQIKVQDFRSKEAGAAANINRVDIKLSQQSAQLISAPRDGVILSVKGGDTSTYVKSGDILATFVPEAPERVIEVFIDGRDIALVSPGKKARIQFEGWPAVQFSGWPSIAIGTFEGIVTSVDPAAQPNGRFRVLISEDEAAEHPWPEDRFVRFGASVRAWVMLETVPVGYELWRQLNNFPPEINAPETSAQTATRVQNQG